MVWTVLGAWQGCVSVCVWLLACLCKPACMRMYVHERWGLCWGVAAKSWRVLKEGAPVVVGVGSYLTGCKKMPPGLLMEETGISSETSIVPACH